MKRNVLTALLCLLIAFALWSYVITVVSPESEATFAEIPVKFLNESVLESRGLMILNEKTPTVTLKLQGNRTDLNKLSSSNITVTVDLSKIYEEGPNSAAYSISYPGDVPNNAVTVLSKAPANVELQVIPWAEKTVPVVVNYDQTELGPDYWAETPVKDVEEIKISGPAAKVDRITQAVINVSLVGKTENFTVVDAVTLCDEDGQPVDSKHVSVPSQAENISVTMLIYRLKTVPVRVEMIPGNGYTPDNTTVTPSAQSIVIYGRDSLLNSIEEYVITLDLGTLDQDTQLSHVIELSSGLTCVDPDSGEILLDVDLPEVITKKLTIAAEDIMPIHVPEGMAVSIHGSVEVTVSGPARQINNIKEEDISAAVSFSDALVGSGPRELLFSFSSRYPDVTVVGTYTILTTVTEIVTE